MSGLRLELDYHRDVTVPRLERLADGRLALGLAHGADRLVLHLSLPSLEALWFELTTGLARMRAC
jgi:hypothetical protein